MGKTELMRVGIWPSAKGPFGLCEVLLLWVWGELVSLIAAAVILAESSSFDCAVRGVDICACHGCISCDEDGWLHSA